ncbi:MAG: DUF3501 family protein [Rhodospirillaceae bacterium]|jgi:hypothetical protein|nr:DUF3501 family protein [Rhodospirillaceae bacterium]MBT5241669.1 DUF3501 family protein [Rhodospirillaceae bacterium]MBT5566871.1 DUF3501 family protein [Rhodospirillaceae bacterium]MBT6090442.1 DUF3501 family protein [Rhodospirillaceae bacterium]MBT6959553.1 DUF3501 family protein [Rhodospirillaceae bacterium]
MTNAKKAITREDLMPMDEYGKIRRDQRRALIATKANRRIHVGPFATFHFENYETMWAQVQEMLYVEKGGEAQIADELEAYNPLIPQGQNLVATLLIEIEDEGRRRRTLATLGHIENKIVLSFGDHRVVGVPEDDVERTTEDGKTSAVHFIKFPFNAEQAQAFKQGNVQAMLGTEHENYRHTAVLQDEIKIELANDLD